MDAITWTRLLVDYFDGFSHAERLRQRNRIVDRLFDLHDMVFTEELLLHAKRHLRTATSPHRVRRVIEAHSQQVQWMNDDLGAEA